MSKSIVDIEGFERLQAKIKRLPHKLKKREMLKILRAATKPTIAAARDEAPIGTRSHKRHSRKDGAVLGEYHPGNLKKSIGNITGKRGSARVNAVIYVGARSKGRKNDGYYAGMVHGGTRSQDANPFLARAHSRTRALVTKQAERQVAAALQRQINKLSA